MKTIKLIALLCTAFSFNAQSAEPAPVEKAKQMIQGITPAWKDYIKATENFKKDKSPDYLELWETLSEEASKTKDGAPPAKLLQFKTQKEFNTTLDWLRWMVLHEKADTRYTYIYANLLYHVKNPDDTHPLENEAKVFLMYARTSLYMDSLICKDKSSYSSAIYKIETAPFYQPLSTKTQELELKAQAKFSIQALSIFNAVQKTTPWEGICRYGATALMTAMEQKAPETVTKKDNITTVTIDTSNVHVETVSLEEWSIRKEKALEANLLAISKKF